MKKLSITFFLILSLLLTVCPPASADVITAMAIEINPEHLEKTASYARILGYNEEKNTLTVELIVPERFDREEVLALQVGDSIYTDGREVLIESITPHDMCDVVAFNDWELFLLEDRDGFYDMMDGEDDHVWTVIAQMECPVTENLLFLDYINENSGDILSLPVVRTADEFLYRLANGPVAFDANNVYVVFDGEGNLAAIQRFYVPWQ